MKRLTFGFNENYRRQDGTLYYIFACIDAFPAAMDTDLPNQEHLRIVYTYTEHVDGFHDRKTKFLLMQKTGETWSIGKPMNQRLELISGHFSEWLKERVLTHYEQAQKNPAPLPFFDPSDL